MKTKSLLLTFFFAFCGKFSYSQVYTAAQLYKERSSNSQAFEKKFFNKNITVTGKIWRISPTTTALPGFKNYHQVALTGTGYEAFIMCQIPFADKAILDKFSIGQQITVTGIYNEKLLDYVVLNDCVFSNAAKAVVQKKTAPATIPPGSYNVYQRGGGGFSFQYKFQLKNHSTYVMNGKTGRVVCDRKTNIIRFTSGSLKGFTGLYRPTNPTNENDPPTIVLDVTGKVPDLKRVNDSYQYAYLQK